MSFIYNSTITMAHSRLSGCVFNPVTLFFSYCQEYNFPLCALQLKNLRIITAMFTISHTTLFTEKVLNMADQSDEAPERGGQRGGGMEREKEGESCQKKNPTESRSEHKRHSRE